MTLIDSVVDVPEDRIITLQFPPNITPGTHQIVLVIEELPTSPDEPKP